MSEYCEAVELLLARMDSNPEEFEEGGRWEKLIVKYRTYLPVQDRTAMEDKINALRLDTFHKDVMNKLLAEPSEDVERVVYTGALPISTPVNGVANNNYAQMPNTYLAGQQPRPSTLTNVGVGSALTTTSTSSNINLSTQSIKDIAAAMSQYASNVWKP
jgi:hypothetical protein